MKKTGKNLQKKMELDGRSYSRVKGSKKTMIQRIVRRKLNNPKSFEN
jgi:hypothetical protein